VGDFQQLLPLENFQWIHPKKININEYEPNENIGYLLEVDLEYPKELHDLHNGYPLETEHFVINGCKKLTPNLHDKKNI